MKLLLIFGLMVTASFAQGAKETKLTSQELIARHVASIGTGSAIAAAKSRLLVGNGYLAGGEGIAGRIGGPVQFASKDNMLLLAMIFNSNDYPYEKVAFDGKDVTTGKPFGDTDLGSFIRAHAGIVRQGLFGGVLSAAWPLLNMEKGERLGSISEVTNSGTRLIKASYSSTRIGDLSVTLYFDAATYRHVMTEYKYTVQPPTQMIISEAQNPSYFSMVETFSNFKKAGDLVLPLTHQIDVSEAVPGHSSSLRWTAIYRQVYFDQVLEKTAFKVS